MKWRWAPLVGCACVVAIIACANGSVPITPSCTGSQTVCGLVCADIQTDSDNCGRCANQCPTGQACVSGACTAVCPSHTDVVCGDGGAYTCVNAQSDNFNCGGCGKHCAAGTVCVAGNCASSCSKAETKCVPDGGVAYCANLQTDNANCGACGAPCGPEEVCASGSCSSSCNTDQTICSDGGLSYCANLQTDNANCGTCGNACTGTYVGCSGGTCSSQCSDTQSLCKPDGGAPYCADIKSDNVNCGTCGNVCPTTKPLCSGGTCVNGSVQPCQTGNDLETGAAWVVCKVDSTGAWVSHNNYGGANYHALQICQTLGYTKVVSQGGTYAGTVCGYNQPSSSCTSNGSETFDGGGSCGSDGYGIILCLTVQWKCQ